MKLNTGVQLTTTEVNDLADSTIEIVGTRLMHLCDVQKGVCNMSKELG